MTKPTLDEQIADLMGHRITQRINDGSWVEVVQVPIATALAIRETLMSFQELSRSAPPLGASGDSFHAQLRRIISALKRGKSNAD